MFELSKCDSIGTYEVEHILIKIKMVKLSCVVDSVGIIM